MRGKNPSSGYLEICCALVVLLSGTVFAPREARAEMPLEYQVKMAYLYNFAKFIQWPDSTFADSTSPIVIALLGKDPFGSLLDRAVEKRRAQGRSMQIKRPAHLEVCPPATCSSSVDPRRSGWERSSRRCLI